MAVSIGRIILCGIIFTDKRISCQIRKQPRLLLSKIFFQDLKYFVFIECTTLIFSRIISFFNSSKNCHKKFPFQRNIACFSFFQPPGFRDLYALFSPIIIRAVPAAVRPGHERKSSSCRYNHPHESAHIQFRPLPVLLLSVPRYQRRTQDDADHRLPGGLYASAGFPQQKSPVPCVH